MTPAEEQALAASILEPWYEREREGVRQRNPVAWRAIRDIAELANWIQANRVMGGAGRAPYEPAPETAEEAEARRETADAEAERIAARSAALMAKPVRTIGDALVRVAVTTTEADLQGDL